ncbi:MAG: glycogen/starch synthase [Anaerolineales bacterium]
MSATLNILFLAAEAEPFVKIGGLADVAGSLPLALRDLSYQATQGVKLDVRLVLPLHRAIRAESATLRPVAELSVYRRGGTIPAQVFEMSLGGMPVYFIDGDPLSVSPSVYSLDPALDREKFTFFSMAALEMVYRMDWRPDIIHANDWHTALALYALRSRQTDPVLARMHSVLTLHNLPYMGGEAKDTLMDYGLTLSNEATLPAWARTQPLPLGLWAADAVVPVSPTYAREILTPDFGCGLETFLNGRSNSITGILNGLDMAAWDPETDKTLAEKFSFAELPMRAANKAALQRQLGLPEEARIPLLAMIGRIDPQKGVDITLETLRRMTDQRWQFVILGSSDPALENAARALQAEYPERIRAEIRFDAKLSRLIYAGADMLLMPSRYEPCGLAQMIAMRYGCVPVVHATGGLKDTIQEDKTGFLFQKAEVGDMLASLQCALSVYSSPEKWECFQRSGMQQDFSWSSSAARYAMIYRSLSSSSS